MSTHCVESTAYVVRQTLSKVLSVLTRPRPIADARVLRLIAYCIYIAHIQRADSAVAKAVAAAIRTR